MKQANFGKLLKNLGNIMNYSRKLAIIVEFIVIFVKQIVIILVKKVAIPRNGIPNRHSKSNVVDLNLLQQATFAMTEMPFCLVNIYFQLLPMYF
jgi:hypothetical protein